MVGMVFLLFLSNMRLISGQLPSTESLRNVTHCDKSSALNIACGADEMIAIHSVQLAYNVACETTCCNVYDSSDCFADFDSDIIREFRRVCSGRQSCSVSSIQSTADFCAVGVRSVSYVFLQYYCIPGSRTLTICDTAKTLTSDGPPLYITSANYPGVTIGSTSCACSIEVNSCSSSITIYEADIDLYLDTNNCQQNVVFKDGTDGILTTFGCESYYTEYITSKAVNNHYSKTEFINNSTANQEGLFFLGLKASEEGVSFSLSCSSVSENWCVGCGPLQNITNGEVELRDTNDTSYGAIADVSCNEGHETNTPTISCQENNTWPDPVCTVTDCGPAPVVPFGNVTLDGTTIFGSTASVECEKGYRPSKTTITCLALGQWETSECNQDAVTTPVDGTRQKTTTLTDVCIVIITVSVVIGALVLVQICLVIVCHCHLKSIRERTKDKQGYMPKLGKKMLVGSVPLYGFKTIYRIWKKSHTVMHMDASKGTESTVDNSYMGLKHGPLENKTDYAPKLNGMVSEYAELNFNKHRQLPTINGTTTRTHGDQSEGMAPTLHKQKLPPILQHADNDHNHSHFPAQVLKRRGELQPVMDEARKHGKHAEFKQDQLFINNCLYQPEDQKHHDEHNVKVQLVFLRT